MSRYCSRMSVKQWLICCNTSRVSRLPLSAQTSRPGWDRLGDAPSSHTNPPSSFTLADRSETNFFEGEPLTALSTLSYSENVDLQRSAALAFAEITEKVGPAEPLPNLAEPKYRLSSVGSCIAGCARGFA